MVLHGTQSGLLLRTSTTSARPAVGLALRSLTLQILGDRDAGFSNSSEYRVGANFYPFASRNYR